MKRSIDARPMRFTPVGAGRLRAKGTASTAFEILNTGGGRFAAWCVGDGPARDFPPPAWLGHLGNFGTLTAAEYACERWRSAGVRTGWTEGGCAGWDPKVIEWMSGPQPVQQGMEF